MALARSRLASRTTIQPASPSKAKVTLAATIARPSMK
jgi:hypothetical protein